MMDLPEPDLPAWRRAITVAVAQWTTTTTDEAGTAAGVQPRSRMRLAADGLSSPSRPLADRVAVARRDGVAAMTLDRGLPATGTDAMPWLLAGAKTLSYAVNMAALRHAAGAGADDVVFVSSDGYILEGRARRW